MAGISRPGFFDNAISIRWRNLEVRMAAFERYGGFACTCCGEQEFSFLTLDHIDGEGNAQRLLLFKNKYIAGHHMYRRLRQMGYPEGYQVLCMNCQVGRRDNGGVCPHQRTCSTRDDLIRAFDTLRVGSGNHSATLTAQYQAALKRVARKSAAFSQRAPSLQPDK